MYRLRKLMAFYQLWMAIELEEFLCMLIWGFGFQSGIANFKLHPGEYAAGRQCCDSSVGAFDSMASELKVTLFIG